MRVERSLLGPLTKEVRDEHHSRNRAYGQTWFPRTPLPVVPSWAIKNHLDSYFWFLVQLLGMHYFTPCGGGWNSVTDEKHGHPATSASLEAGRCEETSSHVPEKSP